MNKKLYEALKTFSYEDWNDFGDYISSPFFVKGRDYGELFQHCKVHFILMKDNPDIKPEELDKTLRKKMSSKTIQNRLSEFNKAVEGFFTVTNFKRAPLKQFAMLYDEYVSRQLYNGISANFTANKDNIKLKDVPDFIPYSEILFAKGMSQRNSLNFEEMLGTFSEQAEIITAYTLDRLLYYATEYLIFNILKIKYNTNIFNEVIKKIDFEGIAAKLLEKCKPEFYYFILRYYLYKAIEIPHDIKLLQRTIDFFENNKSHFGKDIKTDYFQKMQAYYVNKINTGDDSQINYLHHLHIQRLDDKETINFALADYPANEFRDIVIIALGAGKTEWTEKFINTYSRELPLKIRNEETTMARVRLRIKKNDYLLALHALKKQKKSVYHIHNIDSYIYKSKLYFELDMFDKMEAEIDNLNHYLRKKGIMKNQVNNTKTFISKILRFSRILRKNSKESLEEFKKHIMNMTVAEFDKKWFLKMINKKEIH